MGRKETAPGLQFILSVSLRDLLEKKVNLLMNRLMTDVLANTLMVFTGGRILN